MLSDLRYALRQLRRSPGFAATVIATLALGIGACTVMFSVVDSLVIHPLDNPEPDQLVALRSKSADNPNLPISPADFLDWKDASRSFASMAALSGGSLTLTGEGDPRRMRAMNVTGNYFDVLGIKPALGRTFLPEETESSGQSRVVLLSYQLWLSVFGGRTDVLGRTIRLNEEPFTIVGVMPENLERAGVGVGWSDIAVPLVLSEDVRAQRERRQTGFVVHARLKPGVSVTQAQAEIDLVCAHLAERYPDTNKGIGATVTPIGEAQSGPIRTPLLALLGAVGGVLLIACANVANLQLVRATTRQRELSLRTAFGAVRSRLVRLLLTESLVLSLVGGVAGTLLAVWGIDLLRNLHFHNSVGLAQLAHVRLDLGMLAFALALSVATGLLFGLVPAWLASRCDLSEALKQGSRGSTETRSRGRLRDALVVFEVAGSLMLLAGAGLLVSSFVRLSQTDPGFDPRPIAYANVTLQGPRYRAMSGALDEAATANFADAVLGRLSSLPGVEFTGVTCMLPAISVGGDYNNVTFSVAGRPEAFVSERPVLQWYNVSPDYLETMGIRLLRGRTLNEYDNNPQSPRVTVINETLARRYFPTVDPIGQRIRIDLGGSRSGWSEIVGVVSDTVASLGRERLPQAYEPFARFPTPYLHFAVRTSGSPAAVVSSLKAQIHAVDPNLAVPWAESMTQTIGSLSTLARQRFIIQLLGLFSGIALVIAVVGIYGVIAYSVSRRTTEIGIRMALGANMTDVLRLVLGQGARVVGLGLLVGLGGAIAAGRAIQSMLYQTSAYDPAILAVVTLLFAAIAGLACWLPARRATKVDPVIALRAE